MRYFGTDGIRAKADWLLQNNIPYFLGQALSNKCKIIIARDVRNSSLDIEKMLCCGLLCGLSQILLTGILPTPALAYIAKKEEADYAIMITASHNLPEYNGLKVFGKDGQKLSLQEEINLDKLLIELIENNSNSQIFTNPIDCHLEKFMADHSSDTLELDSFRKNSTNTLDNSCDVASLATDTMPIEMKSKLKITKSPNNQRINIVEGAEFLYSKHIRKMFPRFDGVKVRLDCAYGCFAELAENIFSSLGAIVACEHNVRDGNRVNLGCGSTNIRTFIPKVKRDEIGFAFDGDGDRMIAVVDGKLYDGDAILLALSTLYRIQGKLRKKFVVGTLLTNTRLQRELAYQGTALIRTDVGDKYILDTLIDKDCTLGGEKSGHIIMRDKADTGDGIITALTLLEVKKTVGRLPNFCPYPLEEWEIKCDNPQKAIEDKEFAMRIKLASSALGSQGRLIVRASGTEPVIRIVVECFSSKCDEIFAEIRSFFDNL